MIVELPDTSPGPSQSVRLEVAVALYVAGRVTLGQAAKIADLSYTAFMRELDRRGLSLNYTPEDALQDVETVRHRLGQ